MYGALKARGKPNVAHQARHFEAVMPSELAFRLLTRVDEAYIYLCTFRS